eukprot:NODE_23_length_42016_cov_0.755803.p15 type:complete len:339 gc:universal NODE_23_length_42016_cov_0.755803:35234-36250(+)
MNSIKSILWIIGNVIGTNIDYSLKIGVLAWVLFIYHLIQHFNCESNMYDQIKTGKIDSDIIGQKTIGNFKIIKDTFFAHRFEIIFVFGNIMAQFDSDSWRFYDSALLYIIGFGSSKFNFHPVFFSILCLSLGISLYFLFLEPLSHVLWHLLLTGIQSSSFIYFSRKVSLFYLSVMLFIGTCFFVHAVRIFPQKDNLLESDSVIEDLLTMDIPILTLLPAAFELLFLIKTCLDLTLQELFLNFILAEILKFLQLQKFSILLSVVWFLTIAIYLKSYSDDLDILQTFNLTSKQLFYTFIILLLSTTMFCFNTMIDEDRLIKYRYGFVNNSEDHFLENRKW